VEEQQRAEIETMKRDIAEKDLRITQLTKAVGYVHSITRALFQLSLDLETVIREPLLSADDRNPDELPSPGLLFSVVRDGLRQRDMNPTLPNEALKSSVKSKRSSTTLKHSLKSERSLQRAPVDLNGWHTSLGRRKEVLRP
jgi:hypothetical protein